VAERALKQQTPNANSCSASSRSSAPMRSPRKQRNASPFPESHNFATCHPSWGPELPHLNHAKPKLRDPGPGFASVCEGPQCKKAPLGDMVQVLLGAAAPPCSYNGAFSDVRRLKGTLRVIPNDVHDQIDTAWRTRQRRQHSCKWHVSSHRRLRHGFHVAHRIRNTVPGLANGEEGFLCTQS
jgi:hypothetical protein